jgi:hypothetical protein
MKKFQEFQKNYDEAIETIKKFMEVGPYEPQMNELVKWMLETDINPYSFLPPSYASGFSSAEVFASLLHEIHHAVYDDGDIAFIEVNKEPRIFFIDKYSRNLNERIENQLNSFYGNNNVYNIKVLDITPNEFGPLCDEAHKQQTKEMFFFMALMHGIERGIIEYNTSEYWDEQWIDGFKEYKKNRKTIDILNKTK